MRGLKGGSVLAMILRLQQLGINDRDIYLFDTFEDDRSRPRTTPRALRPPRCRPGPARSPLAKSHGRVLFDAERFNEDDVRRALLSTGYPAERLHCARQASRTRSPSMHRRPWRCCAWIRTGMNHAPRAAHLWPRLQTGGVMIIDDYGHGTATAARR